MNKFSFERQIYVISDSVNILKKAVDDGAKIIQLRDKSGNSKSIQKKTQELISYKIKKHFLFILNDYPKLAADIGADGVHIGQDTSSVEARKIVGPNFIVGKSTHSLNQGLQAENEGVNYVSVGPVFATPTKPGRKPVGLEYVRQAAQHFNIPFVAIGGIDLTNIEAVLSAGAKTVGVVRAAGDTRALLVKIRELCASQ